MLKTSFIAAILSLSSCANAFRDTTTLSIWSFSRSSSVIQSLKSHVPPVPSQNQVIDALVKSDDLCAFDAVVVVGQPGLHANQLSALPSDSHLKSRLRSAVSKVHFPYVPIAGAIDHTSVAREIAASCGVTSTQWGAGQVLTKVEKSVVHIELPEVHGKDWTSYDTTLELNLDALETQLDSYAVVLTGVPSRDSTLVTKRQQPNSLSAPGFINHPSISLVNVTAPTGGILARYQLLTPGLLTSLLIAFGLLIPLLMVGITALASIQNPIRTETPKAPSLEKKNQ